MIPRSHDLIIWKIVSKFHKIGIVGLRDREMLGSWNVGIVKCWDRGIGIVYASRPDMRTAYAYYTNDDCFEEGKKCMKLYKIVTCLKHQNIRFFCHGEHTGTNFQPKIRGMTPKVIELVEQIIYDYCNQP